MNTRKRISIILVLTMLLATVPFGPPSYASNSSFSDVSTNHWAYPVITELSNKGIINGMGNGIYQPNGQVTRGQFVKLLVGACGGLNSGGGSSAIGNDVESSNWVFPYLSEATADGIVGAVDCSDGRFNPDQSIDRKTAVKWMMRGLGISGDSNSASQFSDVSSYDNEFYPALSTAVDEVLISGYPDGTFRPGNTLTRAESAAIIKRVMDKYDSCYSRDNKVERFNIDYADGVKVLENNASTNKLESYDENSGIYVFSSIDETLRSLNAGDVFVINNSTDFPGGLALKVASIDVSGDRATIHKDDIQMADVFDDVDIYATRDITAADIDPASVPEGFTLMTNSETGFLPENNMIASLYGVPDLYATSYSTPKGKFAYKVNLKNEGINITGDIEFSAQLNAEIEQHFGKLESVDIWLDTEVSNNLSVSAKSKIEFKPIKIGHAEVPIGATGLFAEVDLYFKILLDGSIGISYEYSSPGQYGVRCSDGSIKAYKNSDPSFESVDVALKGGFELGLKLTAGVTFFKELIKADVYAEAGPRIEAKESLLSATTDGSTHTCFFCLAGDIALKTAVGAELEGIVFDKIEVSKTFVPSYWDFHLSKPTEVSPLHFGWGECENKTKPEYHMELYLHNSSDFLEPFMPEGYLAENVIVSTPTQGRNQFYNCIYQLAPGVIIRFYDNQVDQIALCSADPKIVDQYTIYGVKLSDSDDVVRQKIETYFGDNAVEDEKMEKVYGASIYYRITSAFEDFPLMFVKGYNDETGEYSITYCTEFMDWDE